MKLDKIVIVVIAALEAVPSLATVFPSAGGDIASPAAWGLETVPTEIELNQPGAYTASTDLTLSKFLFGGGDLTLSLGASKMTVDNSSVNSFYANASDSTVTLDGGFYDLKGKVRFGIDDWSSPLGVANVRLIVSNGCVVTNAYSISAGSKGDNPNGSVITVTGSGSLIAQPATIANAPMRVQYCNNPTDPHSRIEVLDGGEIYSPSAWLYMDDGGSSASVRTTDVRLLVRGAGSKFTANRIYLGSNYQRGGTITFSDSASGYFADSIYLCFGSEACDETIEISSNATVSVHNFQVGGNNDTIHTAHGNRMYVFDGGEAIARNMLMIGNSSKSWDNGVVISNATARLYDFVLKGHDNFLTVTGKDTDFDVTKTGTWQPFVGNSHDNRFTLDDGAVFRTKTQDIYFGINNNASSNNFITVKNGAVLDMSEGKGSGIQFGYGTGNVYNTLEVLAGGVVTNVGTLTIKGEGNGVFVSNGVFHCDHWGWNSVSRGNFVHIEGPEAKLVLKQHINSAGTRELFGSAREGRIEVTGGATVMFGKPGDPVNGIYYGISGNGISNTVRVAGNGSHLNLEGRQLYLAYTSGMTNSVLRIEDGGLLTCGGIIDNGSGRAGIPTPDHRIVIDSGTLNSSGGIQIGVGATNMTLAIKGSHPRLRALSGQLYFDGAAAPHLDFSIPAGGYSGEDCIPIRAKTIVLNASTIIDVNLDDYVAMLESTEEICLAEATDAFTYNDAPINAANAKLVAMNAVLRVENNRLLLKTRVKQGMQILIR